MDRQVKKYLYDIQSAIESIESFVAQKGKRFDIFLSDHMFRSAIERQIGIIGEAMSRAMKLDPTVPITDAKKIVGTRNYVIHAYDSLTPEIIWEIVVNDLSLLKDEVKTLLSEK